jgi:hypothetical protein
LKCLVGIIIVFQAPPLSVPSPKVKKKVQQKKIQTLERIDSEDVVSKKAQKSEKMEKETTSTSG